jgi:hypothetical protein
MNPQSVAEWLMNNPGHWYMVAEIIGNIKPDYLGQLQNCFDDMAYYLGVDDRGDDYDPTEQQEWHDYDPDC